MAKLIWREHPRNMRNDGHSARGPREGEQQQRREGSDIDVAPKGIAGKDDKLEVKKHGAWYAAELRPSKNGCTTMRFEGYSDDEEEWTAEQFKSLKPLRDHVRVVSAQLQDEQCGLVRLQKVVCALRKSENDGGEGWHDAVVTAVRKEHHKIEDTGEICTCSFKVLWRDGPDEGQEKDVGCGEICLLSYADVETHPLIVDILRHADDQGGAKAQEEELPAFSAPEKREREGETDNSTGSPPGERHYVRRFKRLKSKSNLDQVNAGPDADMEPVRLENDHVACSSPDTGIQDVPSPTHSVEQKSAPSPSPSVEQETAKKPSHSVKQQTASKPSHSAERAEQIKASKPSHSVEQKTANEPSDSAEQKTANTPCLPAERKMRGQIENPFSSTAVIPPWARLASKSGTGPLGMDCLNQLKHEVRISLKAAAAPQAAVAKAKIPVELTKDEGCKVEFKKENVISRSADPLRHSKSELHASGDVYFQSREKRPGSATSGAAELDEKKLSCAKADPMPQTHIKQERREIGDPISNAIARGTAFIDLTEDEDCKVEFKKENAISPKADPFQESKSEVRAAGNVYFQSSEKRPSRVEPCGVAELDEKKLACAKASPLPEIHIKQKRPESVDPSCEERHSKKVRITLDFDIDTGQGKITSCSADYEQPLHPAGKPLAKAKATGKVEESGPESDETLADRTDKSPPGPKDEKVLESSVIKEEGLESPVKEEKVQQECEREEPRVPVSGTLKDPVSHRKDLGGRVDKEPPKTDPAPQRQIPEHSSKEELVDSKCHTRLPSAAKTVICLLSDEEDDCVVADKKPSTSSRRFSNYGSERDDPLAADEQEGWVAKRDNRTRTLRNRFVKNALTNHGCIVTIDNLEVGIRPADVMDILLKFCDKERIQSIRIPPPHPLMNGARGFVVFVDAAAAHAAAGVLSSNFVVSAGGRPWFVSRPSQEDSSFPTPSISMKNFHDGKAISSSGGLKLVTREQLSEYNAAEHRLRVFQEHRKQARVMFQRHSQEERGLPANRPCKALP